MLDDGRGLEAATWAGAGHTISAVAGKLGLGYKTVANYQSAIRHKLGV